MAKDKKSERLLGTVTKVYDSGISLTDKDITVNGKFSIGDVLVQDLTTKKISKKTKDKPAGENKNGATNGGNLDTKMPIQNEEDENSEEEA